MKKKIVLWFLEQLNLPYHKKLFWQIKLTGNLSKYDDVSLSQKNIEIYKHAKSDPHRLIRYIELCTDSGKSIVFTNYGKGEIMEGNIEDGLIGII